jgi:hypothetical protein
MSDLEHLAARIDNLETLADKAARLGRPRHFDITAPPWRRRFALLPVRMLTMRTGALTHFWLWLGWYYERPGPFEGGACWRVAEKDAAQNPRFWAPPKGNRP